MNGQPLRRSPASHGLGWADDDWVWACRLAVNAETFVRLLEGERVPVDELDPSWIEKYRRRFPWRFSRVPS